MKILSLNMKRKKHNLDMQFLFNLLKGHKVLELIYKICLAYENLNWDYLNDI